MKIQKDMRACVGVCNMMCCTPPICLSSLSSAAAKWISFLSCSVLCPIDDMIAPTERATPLYYTPQHFSLSSSQISARNAECCAESRVTSFDLGISYRCIRSGGDSWCCCCLLITTRGSTLVGRYKTISKMPVHNRNKIYRIRPNSILDTQYTNQNKSRNSKKINWRRSFRIITLRSCVEGQ